MLCWFIEAAADEREDSELLATEFRLLKLFSELKVFNRELSVSSDRSWVPAISWLLFSEDDWERMCEASILDFKLSLTVAVRVCVERRVGAGWWANREKRKRAK